jgi:hypothetical protein
MGQTTFSGPVVSQNGFIENSFTTAQRDAIANPTAGLLIYNTTTNEYEVYTGSGWQAAFGPPAPTYPVFTFTRTNTGFADAQIFTNPTGTSVIKNTSGAGTFTLTPYTLGSAWNVTSLTAGTAYTAPFSMFNSYYPTAAFNGNGTQIITFISDGGIFTSTMPMTSAYDVTTLTGTWTKNNSTDEVILPGSPVDLCFSGSGTKAYVLCSAGGTYILAQYNLSSAYDRASFMGSPVSTINVGSTIGVSGQFTSFTLSADGLYGYLTNKSNINETVIYEVSFGTANDITTMVATPLQSYNMDTLAGFSGSVNYGGIALDSTGLKMLVAGPSNNLAQLTA